MFKKIEIPPDVWYSGCSTGWMVYCASSSDSFGLGLLVFSLKSLMKDGTAVSLCRLVLQDGEDSLTPLGSHLK